MEGTLSEYVVAKPELLQPLPEHMSFEQGAAALCAGLTSFIALAEAGQVKAGDRVFINGGSGGTGTWGILVSVPSENDLGVYLKTSICTIDCESVGRTCDYHLLACLETAPYRPRSR